MDKRVTRGSKFPTNEVIPSMIRFEASCNQNLRDTRLVPWSAATNHGWCTSLLSKWVYFTNVTRVYFRYIVSIVSRVYIQQLITGWWLVRGLNPNRYTPYFMGTSSPRLTGNPVLNPNFQGTTCRAPATVQDETWRPGGVYVQVLVSRLRYVKPKIPWKNGCMEDMEE